MILVRSLSLRLCWLNLFYDFILKMLVLTLFTEKNVWPTSEKNNQSQRIFFKYTNKSYFMFILLVLTESAIMTRSHKHWLSDLNQQLNEFNLTNKNKIEKKNSSELQRFTQQNMKFIVKPERCVISCKTDLRKMTGWVLEKENNLDEYKFFEYYCVALPFCCIRSVQIKYSSYQTTVSCSSFLIEYCYCCIV